MVPSGISSLELFDRDWIFAPNVACYFGRGEDRLDAVQRRSGDASQ
jgi:hypothetical protein